MNRDENKPNHQPRFHGLSLVIKSSVNRKLQEHDNTGYDIIFDIKLSKRGWKENQ